MTKNSAVNPLDLPDWIPGRGGTRLHEFWFFTQRTRQGGFVFLGFAPPGAKSRGPWGWRRRQVPRPAVLPEPR
jgi:hypothetical protein